MGRAALRRTLAHGPGPRTPEGRVGAEVCRACAAPGRESLVNETVRQSHGVGDRDAGVRLQLVGRRCFGIVVVDAQHHRALLEEPGRTSNRAEALERLGDAAVRADVMYGRDA